IESMPKRRSTTVKTRSIATFVARKSSMRVIEVPLCTPSVACRRDEAGGALFKPFLAGCGRLVRCRPPRYRPEDARRPQNSYFAATVAALRHWLGRLRRHSRRCAAAVRLAARAREAGRRAGLPALP